jgi:hypothetical protein
VETAEDCTTYPLRIKAEKSSTDVHIGKKAPEKSLKTRNEEIKHPASNKARAQHPFFDAATRSGNPIQSDKKSTLPIPSGIKKPLERK